MADWWYALSAGEQHHHACALLVLCVLAVRSLVMYPSNQYSLCYTSSSGLAGWQWWHSGCQSLNVLRVSVWFLWRAPAAPVMSWAMQTHLCAAGRSCRACIVSYALAATLSTGVSSRGAVSSCMHCCPCNAPLLYLPMREYAYCLCVPAAVAAGMDLSGA